MVAGAVAKGVVQGVSNENVTDKVVTELLPRSVTDSASTVLSNTGASVSKFVSAASNFFSSTSETASNFFTVTKPDVSIPYNAAVQLEYDKWLQKYPKGKIDENENNDENGIDNFGLFQENYKVVTIRNVKAKQKKREGASESSVVKLYELNEFADTLEAEEYIKLLDQSPAEKLFEDAFSFANNLFGGGGGNGSSFT